MFLYVFEDNNIHTDFALKDFQMHTTCELNVIKILFRSLSFSLRFCIVAFECSCAMYKNTVLCLTSHLNGKLSFLSVSLLFIC